MGGSLEASVEVSQRRASTSGGFEQEGPKQGGGGDGETEESPVDEGQIKCRGGTSVISVEVIEYRIKGVVVVQKPGGAEMDPDFGVEVGSRNDPRRCIQMLSKQSPRLVWHCVDTHVPSSSWFIPVSSSEVCQLSFHSIIHGCGFSDGSYL